MTAPAAPGGWQQAAITRIEQRTARLKSFFLRAVLLRSIAGQHLDVRLTAPDGYQARRSYSIASAPGAAEVELAIELLADGEVSPFFHEVAQAGDTIEVRGPIGGHFIWQPADGGPLLLAAGGSGIAPLLAMVRERAQAGDTTPVLMLYSARSWDELAFRDELLAMEAGDPAFRLVLATTRGASRRPDDLARRFDQGALRDVMRGWGHAPRRSYVCGSTGFADAIGDALIEAGLPQAQIRIERYG